MAAIPAVCAYLPFAVAGQFRSRRFPIRLHHGAVIARLDWATIVVTPDEAQVTAWYEAKTLDEEKAAIRRLNKAALDAVVYAPTGFFLMYAGVGEERYWRDQGAAAVLLGSEQDRVKDRRAQ